MMEEKLCDYCNTLKTISFFPSFEWKKPEGKKRKCCKCTSESNRAGRETSRLQGNKGPRGDWNDFRLPNSKAKVNCG